MSGFFPTPNQLPTDGFFGVAAAGGGTVQFTASGFTFGSTGPSFNGPGQTYDAGNCTSQIINTPSGFNSGSAPNPDPTVINGATLVAFGNFSTAPVNIPPNGIFFMIIVAGVHPQNLFTSLDFDTTGPAQHWTLTTASAMFNNPWDDTATGGGYTTWVWPNGLGFGDFPGFPNPITVNL